MKERDQFIDAYHKRDCDFSKLCRRFDISRKTGYKWIERYDAEGRAGLKDRSRARLTQDHRTSDAIIEQILELKHRHPDWGPVTIGSNLYRADPEFDWPANSTIGEILKRHGLVKPRRKRHKVPPLTQPLAHAREPNDVWSGDFKGQFVMGNGRACYPLTISDNYSRLLISCQGLYGPRLKPSIAVYERAFCEYGLPKRIRTDNGFPFAGVAIGGLTPLSVWLLRLGVFPERIDPGCPQQNPRHERMHRTLKAATASPPKGNLSAQQRAFNHFRKEYNEVRTHQSLGKGVCPVDRHRPSPRPYPDQLPEMIYPDSYQVRKVKCRGYIKLHGHPFYLSRQLVGDYVGLEPIGIDLWQLYFGQLKLGVIDERLKSITRPN